MNQAPDAFARLRFAAWLSVGVHLSAGLTMAFVLRHGLETNLEIGERLVFLVMQTHAWQAAWLTWNIAALTMLYFVLCFARAHGGTAGAGGLLQYAVLVCATAVPLDLAAEAIEMVVLPKLALDALGQSNVEAMRLFDALHRTATTLTGCFANGLYTFASVLLIWTTRRGYPGWVVGAGALVGLAGFGLSAAVLAESVTGMVVTSVVLVPAILLWQSGVAIVAGRQSEVDHAAVRAS